MRKILKWSRDNWIWIIAGTWGVAVIFCFIMMAANGESLGDAVAEDVGGFIKKVKEAAE